MLRDVSSCSAKSRDLSCSSDRCCRSSACMHQLGIAMQAGRPYLQAAGQAAPSHRPAPWPQGRGRGRGRATRRRLRLAAFLPPGPAGDLTPTCMQPSDHARHCLLAAPVPGCEAWYFPARAAPNRAQSPSRPGDWRHLVNPRRVQGGRIHLDSLPVAVYCCHKLVGNDAVSQALGCMAKSADQLPAPATTGCTHGSGLRWRWPGRRCARG